MSNPKGSLKPHDTLIKAKSRAKESNVDRLKILDKPEEYRCCMCSFPYTKQDGNFSHSQSPYFAGNNSYLPICNTCLQSSVEQYTELLNSQDKAIERVCLHWDIYINDKLLQSCKKVNAKQSRIKNHIKNCNLQQNWGLTYDSYLQECENGAISSFDDLDEIKKSSDVTITQQTLKFWGAGFTESDYSYLEDKYQDWTARHECKTKAQESIFQKICLMELQITKAIQNDGKVEGLMKAYNDLLGSANVKPVQNNDNTLAEQNTFGTLIQKWETEKPIPEPDPEWKDVDGIVKYISVWFLGHLCKMMGINNKYGRLYEEEMAKYSVDKPQYEDDTEVLFDDVFGGDNSSEQ